MDRGRQTIRQFDTLENAVIRNRPREVDQILRSYAHLDTGRSLALALRYCGPGMVKVLLKHGATLEYTLDWEGRYFYRGLANVEYSYLDLLFPKYWLRGANQTSSTISASDRLKCIELLLKKEACDAPKLLYYSVLFGDDEVISLCEKHHVTLTDEYHRMFAGKLDKDYARIPATRAVFENWTDEQIKRAITRFKSYVHTDSFPVMRYELLPIERVCSEKFFKFAYHNTDLNGQAENWDLSLALVQAGNAEGLAYVLNHGVLPGLLDRRYLLELARKDKAASAQVLAVLVKIIGESPVCEPQKELQLMEEDAISEASARALWNVTTAENATCVITGYVGEDEDVMVPSKIGQFAVTGLHRDTFSPFAKGIGPATAASRLRIRWLQIPGCITHIPENLFNLRADQRQVAPGELLQGQTFELREVVLVDGIRTIGRSAFAYCNLLENVELPQGLETIGEQAFVSCAALRTIVWPDSLQRIEAETFKGIGIEMLHLPERPIVLGARAFSQCARLHSVSIPGTIHIIPQGLFADCTALQQVHIEDGVTEIGDHAFAGCSELRHIDIPNSVESIGEGAFRGCAHLQTVSMPRHLEALGETAF